MKPFKTANLSKKPSKNSNNPAEEVDEASKDSFPASDPPSWTLGTSKKSSHKKPIQK